MKAVKSLFLILLLGLVGCSSTNISGNPINIDDYANSAQNTGVLSNFALDNPLNDTIVDGV